MKKIIWIAILLLLALSLSACAAGPNKLINKEIPGGEVAGFWQGLWHGFISPFTFIISLFNKNLNIYEVYNNGNWYNAGFMLGVSMVLGGGGSRACRKRK